MPGELTVRAVRQIVPARDLDQDGRFTAALPAPQALRSSTALRAFRQSSHYTGLETVAQIAPSALRISISDNRYRL